MSLLVLFNPANFSAGGVVGRTFSFGYNIETTVGRDFSFGYGVATAVGRDFSFGYSVATTVGRDFAFTYTVDGTAGSSVVGRDFSFTYTVAGAPFAVGNTFSFSYRIGNEVPRTYGSGKQADREVQEYVEKWWAYQERERAAQVSEQPATIEPERPVQAEPKPLIIQPPRLDDPAFQRMLAEALVSLKVGRKTVDLKGAPTSEVTDTIDEDFLTVLAIAEADDWP